MPQTRIAAATIVAAKVVRPWDENAQPAAGSKGRRGSVVGGICAELRERILRGEIEPDTRLVELDIAARTGASQASVREALQRLERDGLVERRGRNGTFVTTASQEEIEEIFRIRKLIESNAIRRTARRITPDQLAELERRVENMRAAGRAGDPVGMVEQDMLFHERIFAWAEFPTLMRVWVLLYSQIERFLVMFDALHFKDLTKVADSHVPIIDALRARDADRAAELVDAHVQYVMRGTSSQSRG